MPNNNKNIKNKKIINHNIIFNNVSYIYDYKTICAFKALNNINLEFQPKKIIAIIGSTGSGKSTLIQHINGLLIPTIGEIYVNNFIIKARQKKIKNIKQLRKNIGLVFQFPEYQLFEETIEKDIMFGPISLGEKKEVAKKNAKKYLTMVGLSLNYLKRSPFELSGGQKRRVAIAGILSINGDTLILDEPTAGLDPQGETYFIKLFNQINKKHKKRIIIVTHNMDHVLEIADEVIVLKNGEIYKIGTPFEIFKNTNLVQELSIELPKIYNFIYKLAENNFDLTHLNIRNINELTNAIIQKKKELIEERNNNNEFII